MITPELKDKILQAFIECNSITFGFDGRVLSRDLNIPFDVLDAIVGNFERLNLVVATRLLGGGFRITLNAEAFDVFNRGGFVAQEYLLQKEVEKLLLEIERLRPTLGDKAERIISIANNIAGIAGTFVGAAVIGSKSQ